MLILLAVLIKDELYFEYVLFAIFNSLNRRKKNLSTIAIVEEIFSILFSS